MKNHYLNRGWGAQASDDLAFQRILSRNLLLVAMWARKGRSNISPILGPPEARGGASEDRARSGQGKNNNNNNNNNNNTSNNNNNSNNNNKNKNKNKAKSLNQRDVGQRP